MKVKVCHVLSDVDQSHLIETIGEIMDKAKYEISFVFMGKQKPQLFDFFKERNYNVEFFEFGGRKELPLAILKLRRILKRWQPDVVHTHLVEASLAGLTAARSLGIKNRIHTRHHGIEAHVYYPHGVYYDKAVNFLSKKIIAISGVVADVLVKRENVNADKVVVIPHGFKLENFAADEHQANNLKEKYGLNGSYPIVGAISRFIHWKGVQHIIPAFKTLLETYPEAKLVLANAKGPNSSKINELLRENLTPKNYVLIEFEPEVFALYRMFDAFVHVPINKDFEAFGQVYVEALAMQVPSVFTLSGIANDFIKDHENAIVVPYEDSDAIAAALKLILGNDKLRSQMAQRGKEEVWKRFHADRFANQLDSLYAELSQ